MKKQLRIIEKLLIAMGTFTTEYFIKCLNFIREYVSIVKLYVVYVIGKLS